MTIKSPVPPRNEAIVKSNTADLALVPLALGTETAVRAEQPDYE